LPYFGDIKDPKSFLEFKDTKIDLYIAVTNSDEANIISCMIIDDVLEVSRKFLRLKNDFYQDTFIKDKLNVEELIFPDQLSSKGIENILLYPKINNVKNFKYTYFKLISVFSSKFISVSELKELLDEEEEFIVAVERQKELLVENLYEIYRGDLVYLFVKKEKISKVCDLLNDEKIDEIKNCVVFGTNQLGVNIAKILIKYKKNVKMVDEDLSLCKKASDELAQEAQVLNFKYEDESLFLQEGLDKADMFISAFENDEFNIIKSLQAKEFGIKKIIAINNQNEFYNLMHRLQIIALRGPKISVYNAIIERISNSKVVLEKYFCGGKGVVYMRKIFSNSKLIGKKVVNKFKDKIKILLLRDGKIVEFEKEELKEGDILVAFANSNNFSKAKLWIYNI
jgi:trk system potassium uptake protein TrkA